MTAAPAFKKAGLRETAVLLALAWLVPFAIHLVPWSGGRPLGAYLLPVFWTMLVAVYFYGPVSGLLVGLFAPVLNLRVVLLFRSSDQLFSLGHTLAQPVVTQKTAQQSPGCQQMHRVLLAQRCHVLQSTSVQQIQLQLLQGAAFRTLGEGVDLPSSK